MTDKARPASGRRTTAAVVLALAAILLVSAVIRIRLLDVPIDRDEGEYAYVAQQMLHGDRPYLDAYSMKLPGIFLVYMGILLTFGASTAGIHLGLLLAVSLSTILIFLLARRLLPDGPALVAAAAFALLSCCGCVQGFSANAEPFLLPFALGGFILLLKGTDARRAGLTLFLSGLCFGAAFLVKQHGAAFGFCGGLYLLVRLVRDGNISWGRKAARLATFAGGALLPFAAVVLAAVGLGIFEKFWFYTFVYTRSYVTFTPVDDALLTIWGSTKTVVKGAPALWAAAAWGFLFVTRRRESIGQRLYWIGLIAASALALVPGFYFRPHYYIMALPAAALLIGAAAKAAGKILAKDGPHRKKGGAAAAVLLILIFGSTIFVQRNLLFTAGPREASWIMYGPLPIAFEETRRVAAWLKPRLAAEDTVAVIGSEPQTYFYLGLKAPTPFLYFYYLTEEHPHAAAMREEFIRGLEAARPDYLIFEPSWEDENVSPLGYGRLMRWYEDFRDRHYEIIALADVISPRKTVYRWGEDAKNYKIRHPQRVMVYQRKGLP